MAGTAHLIRQGAIAQQEAIGGIERLLGEHSARLYSAQHDVAGRSDAVYVMSLFVAELVRVVERQQEEISNLRARIEELELRPARGKGTKQKT